MDFALKRLTVLLCLAALFSGCLSRRTLVPIDRQLLPGETRTRAELMADLEKRSQGVSTLVAKIDLDVSGGEKTGVLTEYRKTAGIIQVDRPKQVRIQILAPVIATVVADMVSDGRQYRVSIPVRNKFIVGDANAPPSSPNALVNLRPQHILEALFVDVQPYVSNPNVKNFLEEATAGRIRYYVLSFVNVAEKDGKLLEKVWIDRNTLLPVRKQIFSGDGRMDSDVTYAGYKEVDGFDVAQLISIHRPVEDYDVRITFQPDKLKLNQQLAENAFQLERPAGAELVQIENTGPKPNRKD
jgi:outer membrane lipoprotein-sorting protein